ncbi:caspase family protein [Glycomyces sp. NPDC046736]|uniref:caspase family protein n=1 Tax=Glycomyces sp. NPDC046736 TaxID=3155615 RepID=UPI0033D8D83D
MLIGNALYLRDPAGLPRLRGPGADVAALYEALTDPVVGLFEPDDIHPLLDRPVQELREHLDRFFLDDVTRDDTLLLYYSGHGKLDLNGRLHLCALDSQTSRLYSTSLRYTADIEALIEQSPAASIVTVIDSCHSGAFRGEVAITATGRGRCVMTSAGADQLATDEARPDSPSPFTTAFVEGLRRAEANGHLTAQQLYHYIERTLGLTGTARPQFRFDGEGSIVLARRDAGPAEVRTEDEVAIRRSVTPQPIPNLAPSELVLPPARDQTTNLLRCALESALEEDADQAPITVFEFFRRAGVLDEHWCTQALNGMPPNEIKEAAVEGFVQGIAVLGSDRISRKYSLLTTWPFSITARIAAVRGLGDGRVNMASTLLRGAADETKEMDGDRFSLRGLTTLILALLAANDTRFAAKVDPEQFPPSLLLAMRAAFTDKELWYPVLLARLREAARKTPVETKPLALAEVGVRLAPLIPGVALEFLVQDGDLLPYSAFAYASLSDLVAAAAAVHRKDPSYSYRMLRVANRRMHADSNDDDLIEALLSQLQESDPADSALHELLLHEAELLSAEDDDDTVWTLRHYAEELAGTLPKIAERLLLLTEHDSMLHSIEDTCLRAAPVDIEAARRMAALAERTAVAISDQKARDRAKSRVATAYAAFSVNDALRIINSMYQESSISVTLQYVAAVVAKTAPERIDALIAGLPASGDLDDQIASIYIGVAKVDPHRAIKLASRLQNDFDRFSVLGNVVEALAPDSPAAAAEVARGIEGPHHRGDALSTAALALVPSDPEAAEALARQIPRGNSDLDKKIIAFATVARCLHSSKRALSLLSEAERLLDELPDDEMTKAEVTRLVGEAYAAFDTSKAARLFTSAERHADAIEDSYKDYRSGDLADLMIAWATVAPRRSEELAQKIPSEWSHYDLHVKKAILAMADLDPRRAERMLLLIQNENQRIRARSDLVKKLSQTSPARAESIATSLPNGHNKTLALLTVAEASRTENPTA